MKAKNHKAKEKKVELGVIHSYTPAKYPAKQRTLLRFRIV